MDAYVVRRLDRHTHSAHPPSFLLTRKIKNREAKGEKEKKGPGS